MLHDTHTMGNDRALNEVCLYIDIPAIGEVIEKFDLDDFEGVIKTLDDCETVWRERCSQAESNGRQFAPFEFTAHMINSESDIDAADMWDAFDEGIVDGIDSYWEDTISLHYTKNPAVVISPRNGSSGRSGYDVTVIPSFPVISAYGLNMCQAQGQAQVLSDACIENHAESAEIVVI